MLFRATVLLARLIFYPKFAQNLCDISELQVSIGYRDCDSNGHVNNARYLNFLDWARFKFFFEHKLWSLWGKKLYPIVQSTEISYIRPIYPGERCHIVSKLIYWDDKYLYFEHLFYVKNELRTHARCRAVVFNSRQERQALLRLLSKQPLLPSSLELWVSYLDIKKTEAPSLRDLF